MTEAGFQLWDLNTYLITLFWNRFGLALRMHIQFKADTGKVQLYLLVSLRDC